MRPARRHATTVLGATLGGLAVLAVALAGGCGGKFDLPTERKFALPVPQGQSYELTDTWTATGTADFPSSGNPLLAYTQDMIITQGPGSQFFLLFNQGGSGVAPRGTVHVFAFTRPNRSRPPTDLGYTFPNLFNPVALAVGGDGLPFGLPRDRVFVLDQGDTCLAKFNPDSGQCGYIPIKQIQYFWHVREYGLTGGFEISTFTDTSMAFVTSIAADAAGNVYVGGTAVIYVDDNDPRLKQRTFQYRIYKYARDPAHAGSWIRVHNAQPATPADTLYEMHDGQGLGFVRDPRGMQWIDAGNPGLYVANSGNSAVDKLSDTISNLGMFRIETGDNQAFVVPTDVAGDLSGFMYVDDTGNHRILRFDPSGQFVQRVDVEGAPLVNPVALAADDSLVYVADRGRGVVLRYRRRQG